MKRITAILLAGLMLLALLAGCSSAKSGDTDFVWTREGNFQDADGNYLIVNKSEDEGFEGWSVTFMKGDDMLGWIIQQEGETLHGDLIYDDSDEYIVTISEEGEDGLLMETEDGETYHFVPMEMPEVTVVAHINTEGMGQIAYALEGEEPEFDDEYPAQSALLNLEGPETYVFAAKADEGSKFVKWTKDGEDYSTDAQITVTLEEGETEFIAVFETE